MFSFDSVTVDEEHTYRNIDYIWFYIYIKHNHSLLYIFNMSSFDHWYMVSFFKFLVLKTTAWDGLNDNYVYVDIHINVDCISLSRNWTEPKPKCLKSNRTETEGISGMFNRTEPNRYKQKLNRTEPNRNPRRFDKLRFEPIGSVRFGSVHEPNRAHLWYKVMINRSYIRKEEQDLIRPVCEYTWKIPFFQCFLDDFSEESQSKKTVL